VAGRHVLLEKPVASTARAADARAGIATWPTQHAAGGWGAAAVEIRAATHPCDIRFGAETVRTLERILPWPDGA